MKKNISVVLLLVVMFLTGCDQANDAQVITPPSMNFTVTKNSQTKVYKCYASGGFFEEQGYPTKHVVGISWGDALSNFDFNNIPDITNPGDIPGNKILITMYLENPDTVKIYTLSNLIVPSIFELSLTEDPHNVLDYKPSGNFRIEVLSYVKKSSLKIKISGELKNVNTSETITISAEGEMPFAPGQKVSI